MSRPGNCPKHGRLVLQCPFFLIAPCYLRCMAYSSGQCLLNSHKLWHLLCNRLEHKLKQSWRRRSCGWKMRWTLQRSTCCAFSLVHYPFVTVYLFSHICCYCLAWSRLLWRKALLWEEDVHSWDFPARLMLSRTHLRTMSKRFVIFVRENVSPPCNQWGYRQ